MDVARDTHIMRRVDTGPSQRILVIADQAEVDQKCQDFQNETP